MKIKKFKINKAKIDNAIINLKMLQIKYAEVDTMFISHALDDALNKIGWAYAELLTKRKDG